MSEAVDSSSRGVRGTKGCRIAPASPNERVRGTSVGSQVGETGVYGGDQVRNVHGKACLSMDVATESEVADTEGSTATTV